MLYEVITELLRRFGRHAGMHAQHVRGVGHQRGRHQVGLGIELEPLGVERRVDRDRRRREQERIAIVGRIHHQLGADLV